MNETESAAAFVFDLHHESEALSKEVRTLRQVMALLSALCLGLLLWFVTIALTQGVVGFQWYVLVVVFLCLSSLIGLFFVVIWKTRPGAIGVAIRSEGIEFIWDSGRADSLPWAVVGRDLVLHDYSVSSWSKPGSTNNWSTRRWNWPVTRLSKEAFDAIIRAAAGKGLVVTERYSGTGPIRWVGYRIVRFRVGTEAR
jgi:hypothetical protein